MGGLSNIVWYCHLELVYSNSIRDVILSVSIFKFLAFTETILSKMYESLEDQKKVWNCSLCPYSREKKDHVMKHVEAKHCNLQISCFCGLVFKRRDVYRQHLRKKHPELDNSEMQSMCYLDNFINIEQD